MGLFIPLGMELNRSVDMELNRDVDMKLNRGIDMKLNRGIDKRINLRAFKILNGAGPPIRKKMRLDRAIYSVYIVYNYGI
jgi:hypothetical protein